MKILFLQYPVNININLDACNIHTQDFKCSVKIKLETEDGAIKWYIVFRKSGRCKKLYLRCHHRQQNTGKNNKGIKTTHQWYILCRNKNCNCPAQFTLTVLVPHK